MRPARRFGAARRVLAVAGGFVLAGTAAWADEAQDAVAASAGTMVLAVHAEGAQVYECRPEAGGRLTWQFREPIATLIEDGKTVGRHFAGPSWELADGSRIVGQVQAHAPGTTAADIPWLKLGVASRQGEGRLKEVTTVQRIHTAGGSKTGPCGQAGAMAAEPYAADYVFSRP